MPSLATQLRTVNRHLIHAEFAKQTNQDISYERILAPLDGFEATVEHLIAQGYKGVNVTVPFKFEAVKILRHTQPTSYRMPEQLTH